MRNSTIIPKKRKLSCGCFDFAFSKNMCKKHAYIISTNKRMDKVYGKIIDDESLSGLIADADAVYSQYLRKSNADHAGFVICYTCDKGVRWQEAQCGHYIKRGNLFLRFDPRNTRIQCDPCNCRKDGNLGEYAKRLESENPGITDILFEEAEIVYKPTREEIRAIISEYTSKFKLLK